MDDKLKFKYFFLLFRGVVFSYGVFCYGVFCYGGVFTYGDGTFS